MSNGLPQRNPQRLRSEEWLNNPDNPGMTALYVERLVNYGLTRKELQSGRPVIGISQTGSDISPCNRSHIENVERIKAGVRDAGGLPFVFPVHPIQETVRRPTAALDRNLDTFGGVLRTIDITDVKGFAVCGADKVWQWAQAKIVDNDKVEVWSDKVPAPVAVRYAWADNPICNLRTKDGLPVTPFRSDDFEMTTKPKPPVTTTAAKP